MKPFTETDRRSNLQLLKRGLNSEYLNKDFLSIICIENNPEPMN